MLFVLCMVNDLHILTLPTNAHFHYYAFNTYITKTYSSEIVLQCLCISKYTDYISNLKCLKMLLNFDYKLL